jgi:hypothetical protein
VIAAISRTHLGWLDPSSHMQPCVTLLVVVERVLGFVWCSDCSQHGRESIVVVGQPEAVVARLLLCRTILQKFLHILHLHPAFNPGQRRGIGALEHVADDALIVLVHLHWGRGIVKEWRRVVSAGPGKWQPSGRWDALSAVRRVECPRVVFTTPCRYRRKALVWRMRRNMTQQSRA